MKKALLIIASRNFRDEEYTEPKAALEKAGIQTVTASSNSGVALGKLGHKVNPDITIDQINVADYDAVLFIGGPGSSEYFDNPIAHKIAQDTVKLGKILGAVCAAPTILSNAGVLKGKKATMYADDGSLGRGGAIYTGKGIEIDGNIITASGPATSRRWGEVVAKALSGP
ncbi:MAG: DJ-1/PfpI family protein [Candidatus Margulisiibacteriota bacterium]